MATGWKSTWDFGAGAGLAPEEESKPLTPLQSFLNKANVGGGSPDLSMAEPAPPSSASRYGVIDTTPLGVLSMFDPTHISTAVNVGLRARNISKIGAIQASLGMPETSGWNAINPFSRTASGSSTASLGSFRGTPVSFGGIVEGPFGSNLQTSFTPQEAINRQNLGLTPSDRAVAAARSEAIDRSIAANAAARARAEAGMRGGGTAGHGGPGVSAGVAGRGGSPSGW